MEPIGGFIFLCLALALGITNVILPHFPTKLPPKGLIRDPYKR